MVKNNWIMVRNVAQSTIKVIDPDETEDNMDLCHSPES